MRNGIRVDLLFEGLDVEIHGDKNRKVTGLSAHSKRVAPGDLFIAKKGGTFDATEWTSDAGASGAVAVLTDRYDPALEGPIQIIHSNPTSIEPEIASRFFQSPSEELFLMGITGSKGKTTTAHVIAHVLEPCGLMGTVEIRMDQKRILSHLTTNDIVTNQKYLREMRSRNIKHAVMEVSSHALDQNRVHGLDFDVGIFTNFSRDHLDYHATMECYLAAKAKMFDLIDQEGKIALLNADDLASQRVFGRCRAQAFTFGIAKKADYCARNLRFSLEGTRFTLTFQGRDIEIETKLIGTFNVLNVLGALAACHQRGASFEQMQRKMTTFSGVPGRLESVPNGKGIYLFIDFAHIPRALEAVLSSLHALKMGRIITIFGCGGNRDTGKRPEMGSVVERFSDEVIVTSDNPREEEPSEICRQVAEGMTKKKAWIEVDRYRAIAKGIALSRKGDVVLIAGKGHEMVQSIQGRSIPFDDWKIAYEICNHSS